MSDEKSAKADEVKKQPQQKTEIFNSKKIIPEYGDRMPYVGETVLFTCAFYDKIAKSNNNTDPIPAIITRVWSNVCVNLKIIPDCGSMQDRTSVVRIDANPTSYHFDFIYD
jgi:hypothetical protein